MSNNSIATLGTDIASQMLAAITIGPEQPNDVPKEIISLEEQKRFLRKNIDSITIEDRKAIGNILIMNNKRNMLHTCAEGTVINLGALSPFIVEQMYNLMVYKMNKRT